MRASPKVSAHWARLWADPAFREGAARRYADPEIRARRVRTKNPSPDELALRAFLPPSFLHTGQDPTRCVLGKFPDYQDPGRRLVVEMDGHFKHRTPAGVIADAERDRLLGSAGWRVLHIRSVELRDPPALAARISAFINGSATDPPPGSGSSTLPRGLPPSGGEREEE
jgi:very-short-patch-repair endonuclease